ncbi:MAG: CRISPR-associated protein Cas4 [Myxococcota bacterium]
MADFLPISALNQMLYCPHRAFLMHRCMEMEANAHVWRGRALHRRVDRGETEQRGDWVIERARPVQSVEHGIRGVIDQLERSEERVRLVEFKRGRAPSEGVWPNDRIQVAAQALCLAGEGLVVDEGMIYYQRSGKRRSFFLTADDSEAALAACRRLRAILEGHEITQPVFGRRCDGCSLFDMCLPNVGGSETLWRDGGPA